MKHKILNSLLAVLLLVVGVNGVKAEESLKLGVITTELQGSSVIKKYGYTVTNTDSEIIFKNNDETIVTFNYSDDILSSEFEYGTNVDVKIIAEIKTLVLNTIISIYGYTDYSFDLSDFDIEDNGKYSEYNNLEKYGLNISQNKGLYLIEINLNGTFEQTLKIICSETNKTTVTTTTTATTTTEEVVEEKTEVVNPKTGLEQYYKIAGLVSVVALIGLIATKNKKAFCK